MTDSTLVSPLRRLHHALVEALRDRDPEGLGRPFTVAEIYQDLVPYRTHRDRLGVQMNGDYEYLILRLLSGEEELVALESEHARKEIADELERSNPNTGLFREYAAVDVHLVAEHIPPVGEEGEQAVILPLSTEDPDEGPHAEEGLDAAKGPDAEEPAATAVDELAPVDDDAVEAVEVAEPEGPAGDDAVEAETGAEVDGELPGDDGVCYWCRGTLPIRDNLNFCPFCGTEVAVVPCSSCGEAVEPGWRFCIQCGTPNGEG